ncbi:biotin--[acetyl-CoA-carboxylase] ligase [Neobacillus sp. MM2021_6]|uniref:biotin--[acetyl-CoA-carboxylase] ligase n=1 Tax=Bacillaceae TaxID=186817 RepID=UPI001408B130|nr:biotin--[acetyl-CoA-carboxylase] ligase [Neobacillus sp. OS1-2]MBO0958177.1 biotin--[acetyl-CoA-carboxylase] ligase [Neobacillus sp. MM2021_6]NHC18513.1 biotin--[acetyl-CoA-carboxylase] ligase [Bacillus sp. MM2020_4]WML40348.1 biotin--[acetyl-CoA-carboxylase] ligase [Neobacillus sp. OS1-2]
MSEIRIKLLDAFTNAGESFLSGQHLADLIGCSRTAVWKHIEELRKEGFELEAVRNKGYRVVKTPERITADEIRLGLQTSLIGRNIYYEESVESTQIIAGRLSNENVPEGTIIIAEEQLSGKGRMNRTWHSPKYTGIWMSLILRPNIQLTKAPQLTLLTAVAIVHAIEEETGLQPEIKWPNDILLAGKKVTGILTELHAEADRIHSIIIGIGINVNQKMEDFPSELQEKASSLSIEKGELISRAGLIRSFFKHFEKLYMLYLEQGFFPIKLLWEGYAVSIGKILKARTLTNVIEGKALGITDDGVLILEDETGVVHHIYSADIEV